MLHNRLTEGFVLTYADDRLPTSWDAARHDIEGFIRRMRRSSHVKGMTRRLAYIYVISHSGQHERFHVHLHLPAGFTWEHVQGWWHCGIVLQPKSYALEYLESAAGYLFQNAVDSVPWRPKERRWYHSAQRCQPPSETMHFDTWEEGMAAMREGERPDSTYWQPSHGWYGGRLCIRNDGPAALDVGPPGIIGLPSPSP